MLDPFVFIFMITALPILALAIFLLVRFLFGDRIASSRLATFADNGGLVIAFLSWVVISLQIFKGNFLAPIAGILFGSAAGGLTAIGIILLGALIASIHNLLSPKREAVHKNKFEYSISLSLLACATVYLLFGCWVMSEVATFHNEYGQINEKSSTLTESQIQMAYGRWVVRHHNELLRVLLSSSAMPFELIEEIYHDTTDYNIIYAVLTHPNTPCSFLNGYLADPKGPVSFFRLEYSSMPFSSRGSDLIAVAARVFNDRHC
jgi:hypothetical protein